MILAQLLSTVQTFQRRISTVYSVFKQRSEYLPAAAICSRRRMNFYVEIFVIF